VIVGYFCDSIFIDLWVRFPPLTLVLKTKICLWQLDNGCKANSRHVTDISVMQWISVQSFYLENISNFWHIVSVGFRWKCSVRWHATACIQWRASCTVALVYIYSKRQSHLKDASFELCGVVRAGADIWGEIKRRWSVERRGRRSRFNL